LWWDRVSVYVCGDSYDLVKRRVKVSGGEIKSVEDYVEFVLREVVKEEKGEAEDKTYTKEERIKKRLKSSGYL